MVFEVTVQTVEADGQALLMPDVEVETDWTSLSDDPGTVVKLYQAHGTGEQFHSELKADLDLERLPSGKFQTNELVLLLGMMAYNLLRLIGKVCLRETDAPIRKQVLRRWVRSVIQDLVYLACRLVRHARRLRLSFGRHSP
jgi:predicted metal-dependent hydrolase